MLRNGQTADTSEVWLGKRVAQRKARKITCTGEPWAALGLALVWGMFILLGSESVPVELVPGPGGTVPPITPRDMAGLSHGHDWWFAL